MSDNEFEAVLLHPALHVIDALAQMACPPFTGLQQGLSWTDSGTAGAGDVRAIGSSASYTEEVFRNLSARAAVAISMLDSDIAPDNFTTASALLGLRYDF